MMIQKIKRFGEREVKLLFALEQSKNPVFTYAQARRLLGTSDASVKNVLKRLKKKHRIVPLQKGVYLFAPLQSGERGLWTENACQVVPYLVRSKEYYIGFSTAMHHWGMTEQMPITIRVALRRQKKSLRAVQSRFIFVQKKRLGDFQPVPFGPQNVNFSSLEQTILDGLAFPAYCMGIEGVTRAIGFTRRRMDWGKLVALAGREKSSVRRRLGFLLELLKIKHSKKLEAKFSGVLWLDPAGPKDLFRRSRKWGLKVNLRKEDLLEFQRGY